MPVALARGGCETMLLNLLRANAIGPRHPYVVCFLDNGPMVETVRSMGYRAHVIRVGRLRQAHRFVASVFRLARWLRSEGVSQVISFMEKAHLYASPAAMLSGRRAAWWLHSIDPGSRMLRLICSLPANHVFSDSQAALDLLDVKCRRHPSSVCHCAVDLSRFSSDRLDAPPAVRARLGLPADRPVVGLVARLQRWKGIDVFIRAAARIKAKAGPGAAPCPKFVVVGGEHELEPGVLQELQTLIADSKVGDVLELVGYQSNVPEWMQACDVIVHCSTGIEPFGTVIVEGMALGKTVIAADAGGPREIITHGVDGRLSTPGDDAMLAEMIGQSLPDTPENREIRGAAKLRAAGFSAVRLAEQLAAKLAELRQSARRSPPAEGNV